MKTRSTLALLLTLVLILSGCSVATKSNTAGSTTEPVSSETPATETAAAEPVEIEVLGQSSNESDLNIVRDQLTKNGFNVKLNIQPDYASFKAQEDAGNYDVSMSGWTTVTGNPDYAVRSLFKTGGDYSIQSDPELDALIDKAATQTPAEYVQTYKALEQRLVFDEARIAPCISP